MKRHDQAALFLAKAGKDEALVDEVLGSERVADEIVGFHLQQAAEKLLKGVLSAYGVSFRRTHDLRELMDVATDTRLGLPDDLADLDMLTPYATLMRYEGIVAEPQLDRAAARQMIRRLHRWAEAKIRSAPASP